MLTELSRAGLIAAQKEIEAQADERGRRTWSDVREGLATQVARHRAEAEAAVRRTRRRGSLPRPSASSSDTEDHRAGLAPRCARRWTKQIKDAIDEGTSELETHAAERRRALHEVTDHLRTRERKLDRADRPRVRPSPTAQAEPRRLADVDRRLIDQVRRSRRARGGTADRGRRSRIQFRRSAEAREEAGRRIKRELDRAIETVRPARRRKAPRRAAWSNSVWR